MNTLYTVVLLAFVFPTVSASPAPGAAGPERHTFAIGEDVFLLDGKPFQIRCGEVHAARVPKEYWRHRLKMVKAMGLNTVCAYLFWNMHEPSPGRSDWEGQADAAAFCRVAQEEGLWVLLRPGPYSCAEWEMGGLPWWLLKDEVSPRTRDPRFFDPARRYLKEVGRVLGPLQVTRGGPILMVQVENEYGFFGKDTDYLGALRQAVIDAGFDVPLFACNPPSQLKDGNRTDLFPVVNFGSDPAGGFKTLRAILPKGPLMCGEFYPGWFDTWGQPHHLGKTEQYLGDLEYMLKAGASFSIYMAHGGTTFGLWAGADRPFKPDTSSYDYDAPISEAGWVTDKFTKTRALMAKHLLPGETLPEPPARNPVIKVARVKASGIAPVFTNLPEPVADEKPRTMERYDQGYGCILYRTTLSAGPAAALETAAVHDLGLVFLDGRRVGVMDRRVQNYRVRLPAREAAARLDVLVEAMGRVNFGPEVIDRKGLHGPVRVVSQGGRSVEPTGWKIFRLPLDGAMIAGLTFGRDEPAPETPAFWRAAIDVPDPGDTFLDLSPWGKGVAWVNGRCLGRFWNIGPTQTMYVPGPWLKPGRNEVLIFDLVGPERSVVEGLDHPVLDRLRPERDPSRRTRPAVRLALDPATLVTDGRFVEGTDAQTVMFDSPRRGRYFAIESRDALDGGAHAAIAELALLDQAGQPLRQDAWSVAFADSEERAREDGSAENAIDGQTATFWHTQWGDASPAHPHRLVLDLGAVQTVKGFRYVPRPGPRGGRIAGYRVYVGDDLVRP